MQGDGAHLVRVEMVQHFEHRAPPSIATVSARCSGGSVSQAMSTTGPCTSTTWPMGAEGGSGTIILCE